MTAPADEPQVLSVPFEAWREEAPEHLDAVVIGSGYGGSVAALRLAEAGRRVLVLERGAEYLPGEFANDMGQLPKFLRVQGPEGVTANPGGLFECRAGPGMVSLVANGLGGGSLINAGVLMRPDTDVFAQAAWPAQIRHGLVDDHDAELDLDAAYRKARAMLNGIPFPGPDGGVSELPKAQTLVRLGELLRRNKDFEGQVGETETAVLAIDPERCTRCGDCFTGCNVPGAKQTLTTTYLKAAATLGAQFVSRCLVYTLEPPKDEDEEKLWTFTAIETEKSCDSERLADVVALHGRRFTASLVVVSAGTFGSSELLMRSQRVTPGFTLSPKLGNRLSANGDSLTVRADLREAVHNVGHGATAPADPASDPIGPTITTTLDLRGNARDRDPNKPLPPLHKRLMLQDGAVPGALTRVFEETIATAWMLNNVGSRWRTPRAYDDRTDPLAASPRLAEHSQLLLIMGHDDSSGRLVWVPEMDGVAPFRPQPQDLPTYVHQQRVFDAASAVDGVHLHTPLWRVLPPSANALLAGPVIDPLALTVHPLGGCPMGDSHALGVVDHVGRVWRGHDELWLNLYVLDGSIIPSSLGCNPLWTITALAERAMAHFTARARMADPPALPPVPLPARVPVQRRPKAWVHAKPLPLEVCATERLERRRLRLHGPLRRMLGSEAADCDIVVRMRTPDWQALWNDAAHRFSGIEGVLRLMPLGADGTVRVDNDEEPPRPVRYRIAGGTIDLLAVEARWKPWAALLRTLRFGRSVATWLTLRGLRDAAHADSKPWDIHRVIELIGYAYRMFQVLWASSELRRVIYDLDLRLEDRGPAGGEAVERLRLGGVKNITYAASGMELLRNWGLRLLQRRLPADDPAKVHPGDLRADLFTQLTCPVITLDAAGPRGSRRWSSRAGRRTRGRFAFDTQHALQRSPLELLGGADSSAAMGLLGAYPALLTRMLEFRLPDYSGSPLVDTAGPADVNLRRVPGGRFEDGVVPHEYSVAVLRGRSSSDDGSEANEKVKLRLWRYARPATETDGTTGLPEVIAGQWCGVDVRRARSVLLTHAFGMSGHTFTFKGTTQNFAEYLYRQGWEVWILDTRLSPRTKASQEPGTVDQVAMLDVPAAVDHIIETLTQELKAGQGAVAAPPLQIFAFGQCLGAASLQMALLSGRLSYPQESRTYTSTTGVKPRLPKLAGLVSAQTHMFTIGSRSSQSKTWLPGVLKNLSARTLIPLAVRGPVDSLLEALVDRLFAALPVPHGERCPGEGTIGRTHDDDCATCRRIRFLDAELFKHANINEATHRDLPKLFGNATVRVFAHAARFVEYERLVSEDGFNVYANDDAIARYMALPVRFVHGAENQLFDREGAVRSSQQYARIHPAWVDDFGLGWEDTRRLCDVIEGYGHLDPLIGKRAMEGGTCSPYARLSNLLGQAWEMATHDPVLQRSARLAVTAADTRESADALAAVLDVRFPKAGPWVGPVLLGESREEADLRAAAAGLWDTGQPSRSMQIAFVVDDSTAEAMPDRGLAASAIVHVNGSATRVALEIREFKAPMPAGEPFEVDERHFAGKVSSASLALAEGLVPANEASAVRVAFGTIRLPAQVDAHGVQIECVSHTPALVSDGGVPPYDEPVDSLPPVLEDDSSVAVMEMVLAPPATPTRQDMREEADLGEDMLVPSDPESGVVLAQLQPSIREAVRRAAVERRAGRAPFPATLSQRRREAPTGRTRWIRLPRHVIEDAGADVQIAVGSCAYPGFPFDRVRASESHERLLSITKGAAEDCPQLLFLLGDQIYADATGGFVDPSSPLERYVDRHQRAFEKSGLQRLLSSLPSVCTVDDHEFVDNYPGSSSLVKGDSAHPVQSALRERYAREAALSALKAYQLMHGRESMREEGYASYERGNVRFFVADTRRWRRPIQAEDLDALAVLSQAARAAFEAWLEEGRDSDALHCLLTGSVILPGLVPGCDPANSGPPDSMQAAEAERAWLIAKMADAVPHRFVCVSGDYHLSFAGAIAVDEQVVGASIIAPPFYAPLPYANCSPHDVWFDECIALEGGHTATTRALDGELPRRGSGFGQIRFTQGESGWSVTLTTDLAVLEEGRPAERFRWPTISL